MGSVHSSKFNMRQGLGDLTELEESISHVGLLQPISVRKEDHSRYEIVSGHRRFAACRELGMSSVKASVMDVDDKTAFEIQLTENIQRQSFEPLEEARAFYSYVGLGKGKCLAYGSVSELARRIGKSQEYVSNRMRLLRLPAKLLEKLLTVNGFTVSHAEEIAILAGNPELVEKLSSLVVENKVTVRELERAIPLVKSGTEVEPAIELARHELKLKLKRDHHTHAKTDDSVEMLLQRTRKLLESTLSYVDNASREIEVDRDLHEIWIKDVRMKIHDAVDGVIFCEKIRRGRAPMDYLRPGQDLFIWAG
jgi:ParB family chromosome partitioning protein